MTGFVLALGMGIPGIDHIGAFAIWERSKTDGRIILIVITERPIKKYFISEGGITSGAHGGIRKRLQLDSSTSPNSLSLRLLGRAQATLPPFRASRPADGVQRRAD
jgi:hypothetical protein